MPLVTFFSPKALHAFGGLCPSSILWIARLSSEMTFMSISTVLKKSVHDVRYTAAMEHKDKVDESGETPGRRHCSRTKPTHSKVLAERSTVPWVVR